MKKQVHRTLLILAALAVAAMPRAAAQYQLPNPGFEDWEGGATSEPEHWNSFSSSDGSYASLASGNHHYRRSGGRPGTEGSKYLTIYTKSIVGVKANGNMTTGRIHAGAMSASSSENYNYTQRGNSDHCQPFTGTPDSMYVWVSFYADGSGSKAQVSAIIHGDNDFKSPNQEDNADLYCGKAIATTLRTTTSAHTMAWEQLKVPFVYDGNAQPTYILVNMTTNRTPGGGSADDSLSIDDIEFVYSAWLTGISVDGTPLASFRKGRFDYTVHVDNPQAIGEAAITVQTEVADATVTTAIDDVDDTTRLATLTVTAEDGTTVRTYRVRLTSGEAVGIASTGSENLPLAYPNPVGDRLTVRGHGTARLYDMGGRLVAEQPCDGEATLDTSRLPDGAYLLRIGGTAMKIVK